MKMMPTGFRFNPTDEELIEILERKVNGHEMPLHDRFIFERDLYEFDPQDFEWDHKIHNMLLSNNDRYFYCLRENHSREVRGRGWWRSTSHLTKIYSKEIVVGYKRPLTFLRFMDNDGKRSKAIKTNWIMHEYKLASKTTEWRLCKIKYKGKPSFQEELKNVRNYDESRNNYLESSSSIMGMEQPNFVGEQQQQQRVPVNIDNNVYEPYFEPNSSMGMLQFHFSGEEHLQSQPLQLENLYEPYFTQNYLEQELIGGPQLLPQAPFDHSFCFDYQLDNSQIHHSSYSLAFGAPGRTSWGKTNHFIPL